MTTQERKSRAPSPPTRTPNTSTSGDGQTLDLPVMRPREKKAPGAPNPLATPPRRTPWKASGRRIRDQYGLTLQIGFALALALLLGLTQIQYDGTEAFTVQLEEQEVVQMEQIQQTEQVVKPPPPPRPPAPIEVANDVVIETQDLDFDASLDLNEELDLSAPPPEPGPPEEDADNPEEEIFVVVEEQPVLIGGLASLQQDISYPLVARKAGIEGRVIVQFIVDENGDVTNPTVVRGRHPSLDQEAIRVVRQAKFTPGKQRGRAVKVQMALPVTFRLEQR